MWAAALLFLCGGTGCLLVVAFPFSVHEPAVLDAVTGGLSCLIAAGLWLWGSRLAYAAFTYLMGFGSLMVSAIVADAYTGVGMMLTAFSYLWIAVYSAHFFSRRAIYLQSLLITLGFACAVAINVNALHSRVIAWVLVSGTVWCTSVVLGRLSENMRWLAVTDYLTGVLNRNGFMNAAVRERAIADRTGNPLTVAVLDLDNFKEVNDTEGHAAGDRLLSELGRSWKKALRAGDIIARHGGDEFVLLLPATAAGDAQEVLERLRDQSSSSASWSAGISQWLEGESLEACLDRADRYLYAVKDSLRSKGTDDGEVRVSTLV